MANPIVQEMMELYPRPIAHRLPGSGHQLLERSRPITRRREFDIRLDHNFSSKDSLFARFSYDQANSFVPGGSPGFAEPSPFASSQNISNHGRNVAISETHVFFDAT